MVDIVRNERGKKSTPFSDYNGSLQMESKAAEVNMVLLFLRRVCVCMKKHFGNFSACTDIALQVRLVHAGHSAMAEMYIVVLLFLTCFCVCMQNSAEGLPASPVQDEHRCDLWLLRACSC